MMYNMWLRSMNFYPYPLFNSNISNEFITIIGRNLGRNFDDNDGFMSYLKLSVGSEFSFLAINLEHLYVNSSYEPNKCLTLLRNFMHEYL